MASRTSILNNYASWMGDIFANADGYLRASFMWKATSILPEIAIMSSQVNLHTEVSVIDCIWSWVKLGLQKLRLYHLSTSQRMSSLHRKDVQLSVVCFGHADLRLLRITWYLPCFWYLKLTDLCILQWICLLKGLCVPQLRQNDLWFL